MDTFEIRDEEINVEEIMQKIRENIKRRKENGAIPDDGQYIPGQQNEQMSLCQPSVQVIDEKNNKLLILTEEIKRDLDYINNNWDIQNNSYFISSHRPYTGKFLIKGRELVHGEIKRYVDPMIWKQKEFNASIVRTLNETTKKISEISQITASVQASLIDAKETTGLISKKMMDLEDTTTSKIEYAIGTKVDKQIGLVRSEIDGKINEQIGLVRSEIDGKINEQIGLVRSEIDGKINEQIGLVRSEIDGKINEQIEVVKTFILNEITAQIRTTVAAMNQDIENHAWLANILNKDIGNIQNIETSAPTQESELNYFIFEEQFRGSREDIKQRQTAFLHFFKGCKNVLDIGCGRGEFLELLRINGIDGHGVDFNEVMVDFCRSKGLNAEKADAVSHLEIIKDKSLDGIFIDQVVEHMEPDYLIEMLRLCHKKLSLGYYMLIETVNPLSLFSFANFYLDLSHKKPIHPETLKFLMSSAGFREIELKFFSPIPDEMRLKKINIDGVDENNRQSIDTYNHNIDMLNNILYGPRDYVVIGKK